MGRHKKVHFRPLLDFVFDQIVLNSFLCSDNPQGYLCSDVIGCFVGFISCHQVVLVVFVMTLWEGLA